MIDALHADSSCDSPVVTRTTGGARYTGLNGTIIAVSCVSKDAWTGAVDGVSPSFSMYKVMLHPVDQPSALRCAVLNRTQDGSLRLYWGNYYACPRFDSTRQLTASRSTGAYKPSVDTVEAVSEVAHSCAMVTEAEGPAAGSLPPLAAVPFEEQFDGRVSPELWDASVSTYDRLSYRPRINGSSPDDQEAVAYLQTPPLLMSASAGGGNAMFKIEKLVLPLQRVRSGRGGVTGY
ncbi:hypothetical protein HYH03_013311 [Edaphochlamys debaryana]|uniref:Uncharacterized protein n=1 Tax=Edaphochlamys debaryana TaxID=47281 RepID=A0A836BUP9_9CHLO|nr:hypothetical protein HYH03_013311 [Edaphochlamys debaryana]|eukprot:KAG2488169.1 hypothetical protein HYH03_013311 [Edaphochlamys debaryana]